MNAKQKFFAVAFAGAIVALALLIQAVCKFGFIVLAPFVIGHVSGLIFNYLKHEWRAYNGKQQRKKSRKSAYRCDNCTDGETARQALSKELTLAERSL